MKLNLSCYVHGKHERDITLARQTLIGRGEPKSEGDIQIEHMVLSRVHGEFYQEQDVWYYRDLDSSNGSYVNDAMIRVPRKLKEGDHISFRMKGSLAVLVECVVKTASEEKILSIDIKKRVASEEHQEKVLLRDICLQVKSGEMTLVLGGSGAGKTTFINAVMGYEKAEGRILYGKQDVYRNYEQMKYEIGFVPQKDLLRDADTVFDTLYNAVQMKMPEEMNEPEHLLRVNEIMELMGLIKQSETLVKKLSGGQRKRLSIAMEFAGDPQIFFLDEPDSGLDGVMARSLMEKLREIADMGKIVMVITHAPDRVAELFHKVIVLAKGTQDDIGHLVFHGTIEEAYRFFETDSLEEIVQRINPKVEGGEGRADEFIQKFGKERQQETTE